MAISIVYIFFLKLSLSNYDVFSSSGERSNQCLSGFQLDPAGPYCSGIVRPYFLLLL